GPFVLDFPSGSPPSRAGGFLLHPLVTFAGVGLAGAAAPLAPEPALAVALVWSLACCFVRSAHPGGSKARRALPLLLLGFLFLVSGARATHETRAFEARYFQAVEQLQGPRRCAGFVTVVASPTVRMHGDPDEETTTFWTAHASELDCENMPLGPQILRLYGG